MTNKAKFHNLPDDSLKRTHKKQKCKFQRTTLINFSFFATTVVPGLFATLQEEPLVRVLLTWFLRSKIIIDLSQEKYTFLNA